MLEPLPPISPPIRSAPPSEKGLKPPTTGTLRNNVLAKILSSAFDPSSSPVKVSVSNSEPPFKDKKAS